MSESELWWVSVGGNPCEPARLVDGEIFTIGCCDPTPNTPDSGIILVERLDGAVPLNPAEAEAARKQWEKEERRREKEAEQHSYRRF